VYASPAPGLNRCRSCQFLMLGISLIPSRCQAEDRRRLAMRIRTLSLNVKARLIPTEPSRNGKAPDLRVLAGNVEVGAAWKRTSKDNTVYHSVKLDDPSFPAPIFANLVEVESGYALVWSR